MALRETGGSVGPDKGNPFATSSAIVAASLLSRYTSGQLNEKALRRELYAQLNPIFAQLLSAEKAAVAKRDAEMGMSSLTTDTSGAHDLRWFEETGLAFSTGTPTTAVVVAVIHPDVGMSAVHQNLIRVEDFIDTAVTTVQSPMAQAMLEHAPDAGFSRMMVPDRSLVRTVRNATETAMTEFAALSRTGIPLQGTSMHIFGGDFLTQGQGSRLAEEAIDVVRNHKAMHDGRAMHKGGRGMSVNNLLGKTDADGLVWGGPRHAQYPEPVFYRIGPEQGKAA